MVRFFASLSARRPAGSPVAGGRAAARRRSRGWAAAIAAALWVVPAGGQAEVAWVKNEIRLNLRTGPGVEFRILDTIGTGDRVEILSRGESWTQIRLGDSEGWIPAGYLEAEAPARVQLAQHEAETARLREELRALREEAGALREQNESLASRDAEQQEGIARLTRENLELRAGARWPEWITGAGILSAGMLLGWILHLSASRRRGPRIRL